MMSLFTPFDNYFNVFPMLGFFLFVSLSMQMIFKLNSLSVILENLKFLNMFFFSLKPKMFNKMSMSMFLSFMMTVMMINLMSIFPYNFPFTSHFGSILFTALSVWLSFIIISLAKNMKGFLSHTIPDGTPIFLTFILFLIELTSNLIRPITLSVRLVANILAGHLLMILLSKLIFSSIFLFPFYMGLNMVEIFVALIQSYIFCTMISLYFSEVN